VKRTRSPDTGRNPSAREIAEARRVLTLPVVVQREHPSAVPADPAKLGHINTYGFLPEFYVDVPFECRDCGKVEIWRARDQRWYYEEAKGHIDARAVRCHACRKARASEHRSPAAAD
jgi:predicted RNA-binding Zn-ribbon protein involved in translation (DUF1610 family)